MHALAIAASVLLAAHGHRTKIAVLDIQDVSGNQAANARTLTQIVTGEVSRENALEVVSSEQIRQMLGFEKQKTLLGCSEGSCLAEIGGALGVDYLLTGQLSKIGSHYRLDLSINEQARARTVATVGEFLPAEEDALASAAVRMVNAVLAKAGLSKRDSPALDAAISTGAPDTHHGAKVAFWVGAGFAVAAAAMTGVTYATYKSAQGDFKTGPTSAAGDRLRWMGPLTDGLWAGAIVSAGTGAILYFTAKPTGSGGELGVGGRF